MPQVRCTLQNSLGLEVGSHVDQSICALEWSFFCQAVHVEDSWDLVEQVFILCFRVTYIYIWDSQVAQW